MANFYPPIYDEERPLGRRVTGVYLYLFNPKWVRDVPLWRFMYFRGTKKASLYVGFSKDVVAQELRKNRNTRDEGVAEVSDIVFLTPQRLAAHRHSRAALYWVERLFPGLP